MSSKVAVIIPNWNGEKFIAECLDSLKSQSYPNHVVVVDNGSNDNSVEIIKRKFPDIELLTFNDNAGFAGGVNRGIKKALADKFKYIALFNNDAVADTKWLENLVQAADKNNNLGIVTGKFMRLDKKHIDSTGEQYSIWSMPFPRGRNQKDSGQFDKAEHVFGATGGASLYRSAMLNKIGLFDEKFFAYFEDVDISFRAQLAGWKVWYEPGAIAYHVVGGTSSGMGSFTRYHSTKNFYMLYAKNMPAKLYWKYGALFILQALRLFAGSIVRGGLLPHVKGVARAFINTPHLIRERRRIQKSKIVSTDYIDGLLFKHRPPRITEI